MVQNCNVNCMMCGRTSGQVRSGVLFRTPGAPALQNHAGRTCCGFCGGNLYLEPDDTIMAPIPTGEEVRRKGRLVS